MPPSTASAVSRAVPAPHRVSPYKLARVEKVDVPDSGRGQHWYRYVLDNGRSTITYHPTSALPEGRYTLGVNGVKSEEGVAFPVTSIRFAVPASSNEFSSPKCPSPLVERQRKLARFLLRHRFAPVVFHPSLARSFEYVVAET